MTHHEHHHDEDIVPDGVDQAAGNIYADPDDTSHNRSSDQVNSGVFDAGDEVDGNIYAEPDEVGLDRSSDQVNEGVPLIGHREDVVVQDEVIAAESVDAPREDLR